ISASMRPTRKPILTNAAARLTASVVLPTPPFPDPTAMMLATPGRVCGPGGVCMCPIAIPLMGECARSVCAPALVGSVRDAVQRHDSGVYLLPFPFPVEEPARGVPEDRRPRR